MGLLVLPSMVSGQAGDDWRARFAAGEEARRNGEAAAYAVEMAAAAEAMPEGHLNRPFVQYHAARAAALMGRDEEAVGWLRTAWTEEIESLMISFAEYDDAFASMVGTEAFRDVMSLAANMELVTRRLGQGVHLVQGAGSNVVVLVGADGVLLIDTGYAAALPALRAAIESVGGGDVDLLLVTHPHEDHMGSTPALGAAAHILAHPSTATAMAEPYVFMDGVSLPPKAMQALPDVRISRDTTFAFSGETVRVMPTVGHTEGDLSVYLSRARVAVLGDSYLAGNPMMYPGTEDPIGFLDRYEAFLADMHPETVVVAGHEEPTDLAAVRHQIAESRACIDVVRQAIAEGLSIEETAERAVDRFPPQWVAFFYGVVSQGTG